MKTNRGKQRAICCNYIYNQKRQNAVLIISVAITTLNKLVLKVNGNKLKDENEILDQLPVSFWYNQITSFPNHIAFTNENLVFPQFTTIQANLYKKKLNVFQNYQQY